MTRPTVLVCTYSHINSDKFKFVDLKLLKKYKTINQYLKCKSNIKF